MQAELPLGLIFSGCFFNRVCYLDCAKQNGDNMDKEKVNG